MDPCDQWEFPAFQKDINSPLAQPYLQANAVRAEQEDCERV